MPTQFKKQFPYLICLAVAILICGRALAPGYILLLDMTWAPLFPLNWTTEALNNAYPVYAIIHALTLFISSWVVQKLLLVGMVFTLLAVSWRYLPYITNTYARIFAVGVFALNPFVYARILSGQWFHVIGYALLPFLLYSLVQFTKEPTRRAIVRLVIALLSIGLFSIHFLYLGCVVSFIWVVAHLMRVKSNKAPVFLDGTPSVENAVSETYSSTTTKVDANTKKLFISSLFVSFFFIICSLYWTVPAYMRTTSLESRFNEKHYMAFAASANKTTPVMNNVLALGGFWGEGQVWRYFYIFPQESELFWGAFVLIMLFVLIGVRTLVKDRSTRYQALILLTLGVLAYITALGAAVTPFREFNMFLYEHMPGWNGLRDSQKIAGVLALMYAVFSGIGVQAVLIKSESLTQKLKVKSGKLKGDTNANSLSDFLLLTFNSVILLIPMAYGIYTWGGLHNQIQPVYYPHEWKEAKALLDKMPTGDRVLVLPWHAYLSMPFVNNHLVANPLEAYFGKDRVLIGRDVGIGGVRDQEVDEDYRYLDTLVTHAYSVDANDLIETLETYNIRGILIITNPLILDSEKGLTTWTEFGEDNDTEASATTTVLADKPWTEILSKKITSKAFGQSLILLMLKG